MAKGRVSLKKSTPNTTANPQKPESLSIEKQEEIMQRANLSSVSNKKSAQKALQRLTIDIPVELHQKLKRLKQDQGITSRGLIVSLLRDHFDKKMAQ
jgi:hypothetical protein